MRHSVRAALDPVDPFANKMRLSIDFHHRLLAVVPQQVVPIQAESADGGHGFETGVRSVPIVAVEPGCEVLGALG